MTKKLIIFIMSVIIMCTCSYFALGSVREGQRDLDKKPINSLIKTLRSPSLIKSINITDDTLPCAWWVPKNNEKQKNIILKLITFLNQASIYVKEIPKSQNVIQFGGNIGPSQLYILCRNKNLITICPAYYVRINNNLISVKYIKDVVEITDGNKRIYVKASKVYNWLKNDEWKVDYKYM